MALNSEKKQVHFNMLASNYGAIVFQNMLAKFIAQHNHPGLSGGTLQDYAYDTHIPFTCVSIYYKIKFTKSSMFNKSEIADVVHIYPKQKNLYGQIIPAHFDIVLIKSSKG